MPDAGDARPRTADAEAARTSPADADAAHTRPGDAGKRRRKPRNGGAERGLHELVGAGSSRLGVQGALRARDVNRPTDDDLAEAERTVTVVHKHWTPPPSG